MKKALAAFLFISFLFLTSTFFPLAQRSALAYDSTPLGGEPLLIEYYHEVFEPAVSAPEMNLESFVNETAKGVLIGVPLYFIDKGGLRAGLHAAFICGWERATGPAWEAIDECVQFGIILGHTIVSEEPNSETSLIAENQPSLPQANILTSSFKAIKQSLKTRPISIVRLFEWYRQKLNPASPAYAQAGFGFGLLGGEETIIELWTVFRNAAYGLVAIGLVIAGFMIMFRMKISPQAVVTIQTAIPRLVITLILITFSYAIVGLIFDLIWVLTILFANLLGANANLIEAVTHNSVFGFFFDSAVMWRGLLASLAILGSSLSTIFFSLATAGLLPLIIWIIVGVMVLATAFRIFWMLIKAYIYIVLYMIISPAWIFLGVIPGVKGASAWFKNIISQAIVFPTTAILLVLAAQLIQFRWHDFFEGLMNAITESLSRSSSHLPLMGPMSGLQARVILALGIIFFTPNIAKSIQQLMRVATLGEGLSFAEILAPAAAAWGSFPAMELREAAARAAYEKAHEETPGTLKHRVLTGAGDTLMGKEVRERARTQRVGNMRPDER